MTASKETMRHSPVTMMQPSLNLDACQAATARKGEWQKSDRRADFVEKDENKDLLPVI